MNNEEIKNICLSLMKAQDGNEVVEILKKNDLEIYDVENIKVHGGSNRYYIKKIKNKKIKISQSFKKNFTLEKKFGLHKFSCYKNFSNGVRINLNKSNRLASLFDFCRQP